MLLTRPGGFVRQNRVECTFVSLKNGKVESSARPSRAHFPELPSPNPLPIGRSPPLRKDSFLATQMARSSPIPIPSPAPVEALKLRLLSANNNSQTYLFLSLALSFFTSYDSLPTQDCCSNGSRSPSLSASFSSKRPPHPSPLQFYCSLMLPFVA